MVSVIQVSLCVKRLVYTNENGELVKGVCSNFLCNGAELSSFTNTCLLSPSLRILNIGENKFLYAVTI